MVSKRLLQLHHVLFVEDNVGGVFGLELLPLVLETSGHDGWGGDAAGLIGGLSGRCLVRCASGCKKLHSGRDGDCLCCMRVCVVCEWIRMEREYLEWARGSRMEGVRLEEK